VELEKKRVVQTIYTVKKLTCYKSLLRETVSNERKGAKEDPFPVEKEAHQTCTKDWKK